MAVPKYSQLSPGVIVQIVLKADQSSGKLTPGKIADILTKGDHPRGIKVRLADGQIGRVQSLYSGNASSTNSALPEQTSVSPQTANYPSRRGLQQDVRSDGHDPAALSDLGSLGDYIKAPKKNKRALAVHDGPAAPQNTVQKELEMEFPGLDTALIAAIVADHGDIESVRGVLRTLC
ncbi:hypothetical protein G7Y79_00041g078000 [Physcia stellaris]|nr:hypothetical protein G7Y79_00041g078000 [Physcia stellaris]